MTDTTSWDQYRNKIFSSKGGWFAGKGAFSHDYDINKELVGHISYLQMVIFNATGRMPEERLAQWLGAVFMGLSWPDSRIWCNQIGAFAGSMRASVVAATAAGIMAGDSRLYAQKTVLEGVSFIQRAMKAFEIGQSIEEIVRQECERFKGKPYIVGYARPIANGDERIEPLENFAKSLGFESGKHLKLAYQIEAVLKEKYGETLNLSGYVSAFFSDQGFKAEEAYRTCVLATNSGVTACYLNSLEQPTKAFMPLRCSDIDYQGPPARPVPKSE